MVHTIGVGSPLGVVGGDPVGHAGVGGRVLTGEPGGNGHVLAGDAGQTALVQISLELFVGLEAGVITDEFIETASKSRKLCPHFHLSLQSGCAATLKRMNRHYTPSEYAEKVRLIREKIKECAITTDVIVGFPGETDEEFEESLSFVKQMGFTQTHVFKYSRRAGTVADRMPDQVPEKVKNERSARLIKVTDEMNLGAAESFIGRTVPVLIEEKEKAADGECLQCGFTPQYIRAGVESGSDLINTIVMLKVSGMAQTENGRVLTGKIEKNLQ